jgi:hypothetical protein
MSKKQEITVRFHTEANSNDGSTFAAPIALLYQRREIYLNKAADISERVIDRIYPFPANDGTWGCSFKLNSQGRLRLETLSGQSRGSTIVGFIGTPVGKRQVVDMVIDRPITDGVITIPRGLAQLEILALRSQFKVMGAEKEKRGKRDEKPENMPDGRIDRPTAPRTAAPSEFTSAPPRRGKVQEPDLPRLAD